VTGEAIIKEFLKFFPIWFPILITTVGMLTESRTANFIWRLPPKICLALLSFDTYGVIQVIRGNVTPPASTTLTQEELVRWLLALLVIHLIFANIAFMLVGTTAEPKFSLHALANSGRWMVASALAFACITLGATLLHPTPFI
jgi:hypothetical protein